MRALSKVEKDITNIMFSKSQFNRVEILKEYFSGTYGVITNRVIYIYSVENKSDKNSRRLLLEKGEAILQFLLISSNLLNLFKEEGLIYSFEYKFTFKDLDPNFRLEFDSEGFPKNGLTNILVNMRIG